MCAQLARIHQALSVDLSACQWPAVVRLAADAELALVLDNEQWRALCAGYGSGFPADSVLVDSAGIAFDLSHDDRAAIREVSVHELTTLVREHASVLGHCCVSKLYASNAADAIALVVALDEEG